MVASRWFKRAGQTIDPFEEEPCRMDSCPSKRFSIIIPTRNRPVLLDRCLDALGELNYSKTGFEVLVVDDGSDPPMEDIVARHTELAVSYLRREGQGPARARNAALKLAIGEYVVFTDDDCLPDPNWLSVFDEAFSGLPTAGFGGKIVGDPENGIFGNASQILITFLYEDASFSSRYLRFFCSNNFALPRDALVQLGGFDESFPLAAAEDRDLCARWLQSREMHFLSGAVVRHRQMLDLKSFWQQQYRYGRGAYQFWQRRGEAPPAHGAALLHFYSRMLLYPFSQAPFFKAFAMSILLSLSQLANALGYYAEHDKARTR